MLLGFGTPIILIGGFIFGKWIATLLAVFGLSIGATLLYALVGYFFYDFIEKNLGPKFSKMRDFFNKNELLYFTIFRFVGGGGTPYAIQNILPVLFNMSKKNYIIATFAGSLPSMFVTVALGSGIEKVIDQNAELSFSNVIFSPEIYIPLIGFFLILIIAFIIRKLYLKQ